MPPNTALEPPRFVAAGVPVGRLWLSLGSLGRSLNWLGRFLSIVASVTSPTILLLSTVIGKGWVCTQFQRTHRSPTHPVNPC